MRNFKRAFTIVELIIAIAVVAVLTAILIPTFSNLFKNAQTSADNSNLSGLNSIIFGESVLGEEPENIDELEDLFSQNGLDLSTLKPQNEQAYFAWDNTSKQLVCIDKDLNLLYSSKSYDENTADLWVVVSSAEEFINLPQNVNCYITEGAQGEFTLGENAAFNGDITVQSGANVSFLGNILGNIFVNDGALVTASSGLNLFYPLIISSEQGGQLTTDYALINGNFAKAGEQITINYTLQDGYLFLHIETEDVTIQNSGEDILFVMPQNKVSVVGLFTQAPIVINEEINGVTYTLNTNEEESFYEITSSNASNLFTEQTNGFLLLQSEIEYNGVSIPVKSIAAGALQNIGVSGVVIPQNITSIGYLAFANNPNLQSLVFLAESVDVTNFSDTVAEKTYPFFGCCNDDGSTQLTLYYSQINDVSNNVIDNGAYIVGTINSDDKIGEYLYIPEQNLKTSNWSWNAQTFEVIDESDSDDESGGNLDGDGEAGGNEGGGNGSENPDQSNPTLPEEPQTFTITLNFDFSDYSGQTLTVYNDNSVLGEYSESCSYTLKDDLAVDDNVTIYYVNASRVRIYIGSTEYLISVQNSSRLSIESLQVNGNQMEIYNSEIFDEITGNITITIKY